MNGAVSKVVPRIGLPTGYREWKLISVAHEGGALNDLRAILGNDIAYRAYVDGTIPFPDGAMIARVAWRYTPSARNDSVLRVLGDSESFVAGARTTVQIIEKDARQWPATGGWGFGQFSPGSGENEAVEARCYGCHLQVDGHDHVFTSYAP